MFDEIIAFLLGKNSGFDDLELVWFLECLAKEMKVEPEFIMFAKDGVTEKLTKYLHDNSKESLDTIIKLLNNFENGNEDFESIICKFNETRRNTKLLRKEIGSVNRDSELHDDHHHTGYEIDENVKRIKNIENEDKSKEIHGKFNDDALEIVNTAKNGIASYKTYSNISMEDQMDDIFANPFKEDSVKRAKNNENGVKPCENELFLEDQTNTEIKTNPFKVEERIQNKALGKEHYTRKEKINVNSNVINPESDFLNQENEDTKVEQHVNCSDNTIPIIRNSKAQKNMIINSEDIFNKTKLAENISSNNVNVFGENPFKIKTKNSTPNEIFSIKNINRDLLQAGYIEHDFKFDLGDLKPNRSIGYGNFEFNI